MPAPRSSEDGAAGDTRIYRPQPPAPRLRVLAGPGVEAGREFALARPVMTIGRRDDQDIVLADSSVSRIHARIEIAPGGAAIVDAGSTNGTLVNGTPVHATGALLRGGDRIEIGRVVLQFLAGS